MIKLQPIGSGLAQLPVCPAMKPALHVVENVVVPLLEQ